MTRDEVLDEFRAVDAYLEGHFILSSGLHSPIFLQKALVFAHPDRTERLCRALAEKIRDTIAHPIDVVVSPAVGGIIPGYETARHLGARAIFTEREAGQFTLRRGFELKASDRVVLVEDVITTGLSIRECLAALRATGAEIVAGACLIDRSGGTADIGLPLISLAEVSIPTYDADNLPPELAGIQAVKPGSRGLQS